MHHIYIALNFIHATTLIQHVSKERGKRNFVSFKTYTLKYATRIIIFNENPPKWTIKGHITFLRAFSKGDSCL